MPILKDRAERITSSFDERLHLLLESKAKLAHDFLRPIGDEGGCGNELCDSLMEDQAGQGASLSPLAMDDVDRLSPLDFEALVARIFEATGYVSILTAKGNDGGADVLAFRDGEITLVQAKHSCSGTHIGRRGDRGSYWSVDRIQRYFAALAEPSGRYK